MEFPLLELSTATIEFPVSAIGHQAYSINFSNAQIFAGRENGCKLIVEMGTNPKGKAEQGF